MVGIKIVQPFHLKLLPRGWLLPLDHDEVTVVIPTAATFDAGIDNFVVALGLGGESGAEQTSYEGQQENDDASLLP